ncbi:nucleotide pyrophosphohydrolase [Listeria booriae]|uniref:Nucleotide pyrophosphohydrolase n=1 Tax=Listeria booriae TaxID=1552123 RepID=A0A7X1A4S5_9LIST|nr:nucleotide pyrophosphohydrolase [Listeria booriae]MBC2371240.1 nucleotide pyrophosphohydrolase [Listeria booriae]MBC2390615.1 nucleotide pyrophosphohydrolase [Listeria booriae]
MDKINKFRDERDWRQFHNPKDLSISISLEAAELLENFQWRTSEEVLAGDMENVKEELADILIYSFMLASDLGLDIDEIIAEKLLKNNLKYPISTSKGSSKKYTDF